MPGLPQYPTNNGWITAYFQLYQPFICYKSVDRISGVKLLVYTREGMVIVLGMERILRKRSRSRESESRQSAAIFTGQAIVIDIGIGYTVYRGYNRSILIAFTTTGIISPVPRGYAVCPSTIKRFLRISAWAVMEMTGEDISDDKAAMQTHRSLPPHLLQRACPLPYEREIACCRPLP
jgi:hypothetical protein